MFYVEDERHGCGTGNWKGHQLFVCRRDHACFADIENVMLEDDFDKDPERAKKKATSQKQDKQPRDLKMQERRLHKEIPTRSLSDNVQREASGNFLAVLLSMCSSMVLYSVHVLYYSMRLLGLHFVCFKR